MIRILVIAAVRVKILLLFVALGLQGEGFITHILILIIYVGIVNVNLLLFLLHHIVHLISILVVEGMI